MTWQYKSIYFPNQLGKFFLQPWSQQSRTPSSLLSHHTKKQLEKLEEEIRTKQSHERKKLYDKNTPGPRRLQHCIYVANIKIYWLLVCLGVYLICFRQRIGSTCHRKMHQNMLFFIQPWPRAKFNWLNDSLCTLFLRSH